MSNYWIQTYKGKRIDLVSPSMDDIDIEDIVHSLSLKCRFGGHTKKFYSVAEHCIYVSVLVEKRLALAGLLHDASEAYLVDMSRPLKEVVPEYRLVEDRFEALIHLKYGCELKEDDKKAIKKADNIMLATEGKSLMGDTSGWILPESPLEIEIEPMPSKEAGRRFLKMFNYLRR